MQSLEAQTILVDAASTEDLMAYLTAYETPVQRGVQVMTWLIQNKPAIANDLLCRLYGIAVYRLGDSCFKDQTPQCDHQKWFVSVLSDSDFDVTKLGLSETEEGAKSLAACSLNLYGLFSNNETMPTSTAENYRSNI